MKKFVAITMAALMVLSLAACGGSAPAAAAYTRYGTQQAGFYVRSGLHRL